jgi:hypothetical protein
MSELPDDFTEYTPELGDTLTLISPKFGRFGRLTGTIIFRDAATVRIQRKEARDLATDIAMDEDGDFAKDANISNIILHSKRIDPHFVVQQCILPGDHLEFQDTDRNIIGQGIVTSVVVSETEDKIILNDGSELDFAFIGPPSPIHIINRVAAEDIITEAVAGQAEAVPDAVRISLDLPAATVTEIPTAERTYTEEVQRDEMYRDLLKDLTPKQQNNPILLKRIERETEVLLALKKAATAITEDGIISPFTRSANSLKDVLDQFSSPVSSIIPVLDTKRIVYTEDIEDKNPSASILDQVEIRNWLLSELRARDTSDAYSSGEGGADRTSKQMYTYLYNLLFLDGSVFGAKGGEQSHTIATDQEVYRTSVPPKKIFGFSKIDKKSLPSIGNIGMIAGSQHRVISSLRTVTGEIIAPGDPGASLGYLLLPTHVGSTFRPSKNSGSLIEDIRAANLVSGLPSLDYIVNNPRSYSETGLRIIKGNESAESAEGENASDINVAAWMETNLEQNVHPSDRMNAASIGVNRVIDSIGLRSYEWTPEVSATIWKCLKKAQNAYVRVYEQYIKKVNAYVASTPAYKNSPAIDAGSKLYDLAKVQPEILEQLELLAKYDLRNADFDVAKAQHLLSVAEGTLSYILYKTVDPESEIDLADAINTYKTELSRFKLDFIKTHTRFSHLSSAPEINPCKHVHDLDRLRSILSRDEAKFYKGLHKFLEKYEGGRDDNWVSCSKCKQHLICIHEIMKFKEKTHPGRGLALSKDIIMNFGGAAFNGKYVCKNCGIPIAEFEYDNHIEFDDKGKPLIGRNPVEEAMEQTVDDELDALLEISAKKTLLFDGDEKQQIYDALRTIVLNAGFDFSEEQYKKIVGITDGFMKGIPTEAQYTAGPKSKGKPAYDVFRDSYCVALLTALILCEIHSVDPLPEVMFPFADCRFIRGGYPIETDAEGTGAQEYMVCVVANLFRDISPLNNTVWYPDVESKSRQKTFTKYLKVVFDKPDIRGLLLTARETYSGIIKKHGDTISSLDKIPNSFRPAVSKVAPIFTQLAAVAPDLIVRSIDTVPITVIKPEIEIRAYQLAIDEILNSHAVALETGMLNKMSPRSDSNCCFMKLQDVKNTGMVFHSNMELTGAITMSEKLLHRRDPVEQCNGTHLWVHWSPPTPVVGIPVNPDASYFKMFMRTCATGPRIGDLHEFGRRTVGYVCRHCKFTVEENPLILMSDLAESEMIMGNPKESGKNKKAATEIYTSTLAKAERAIAEKNIVLGADSFGALLTVVNKKRFVLPYVAAAAQDPYIVFHTLSDLVKAGAPLSDARLDDWTVLENIIAELSKMKLEPSSEDRMLLWSSFAERYDILKGALIPLLETKMKGPKKEKGKPGAEILSSIEALLEDPIGQGPSELNKNWVVGFERLAKQFSELVYSTSTWFGHSSFDIKKTRRDLFSGMKWFGKKISEKHRARFETMIEKIMGANAATNKRLSSPTIRPIVAEVIQNLALWLGKIVSYWTENVVSMKIIGTTVDELRYILRWILLVSLESALSVSSPLYSEVGSAEDKTTIVRELSDWVRATSTETSEDFKQFGLSDLEVEMLLLDATEKEKISVIKGMDDEKDPDLRELAKINKKLGLGTWAVGAKIKGNTYNPEVWDFLQEQKARAGAANPQAIPATDFGQMAVEAPSAYDYRKEEHEDEGAE